jgi:hypothetical protein
MRRPLGGGGWWWAIAAMATLGWACSSGPQEPGPSPTTDYTADVTFVVKGIVPEVWKVDIAVNGPDMDPVDGTFETALTDRVTLRIPAGDSLNAFARAFEGTDTILYIGESYFDVGSPSPQIVEIQLNFKGQHWPDPS